MSEEIFDVCDETDRVVAQALRSVVHANRWLHRSVHVFVFNSRGELLLQKRSASKDEDPLKYTTSASGHLHAGEDYDAAAVRELDEELGIQAEVHRLKKFGATPETSYEHTVIYRADTDQAPTFLAEEIETGGFYSLEAIDDWISRRPDDFSRCFIVLYRWLVDHLAEREETST
jgi:16S rRNA (adenine1518-N6/adenine1519-N6)-dimethyltransferase